MPRRSALATNQPAACHAPPGTRTERPAACAPVTGSCASSWDATFAGVATTVGLSKLHETAEALVEVARRREAASAEAQRLRSSESSRLEDDIRGLEQEGERADEELAGMVDRLLALRAKVVRVSLESGGPAREEATAMMRDLDGLNRRLDALKETLEPPANQR